jgi:signal transduction histidine kinase
MISASHMVFVFFFYGLSFFVLGLAILVYPKRNSMYTLAPHLNLVAGFGITHGFNEWLDMFILIQAPDSNYSLELIRAGLLPLSFLFLIQFGVKGIAPNSHKNFFLRNISAIILLVWAVIVLLSKDHFLMGDIVARYLIGLPGALLTSYALSIHLRELKKTGLVTVIKNLRFMIGIFFLYGLLAGAVVKETGFFPGSVLNYDLVLNTLGVPVQVFRLVCAVILAYTTLRVLSVFHWETQNLLREGEIRLRAITSAVPAILFKNDSTGLITSAEGKDLGNLNPDDPSLIGQPLSSIFPDLDTKTLNSRTWLPGEVHNCHVSSGGRTFDMSYSPVQDEKGIISGFVGAALDVTQRIEANVQIEEYRRELAQTKQLTELGTLCKFLSEKLKKPLNVAKLLLQRLLIDVEGERAIPGDTTGVLEKCLTEIADASATLERFCEHVQVPLVEQADSYPLDTLLKRVIAIFSERAKQANLDITGDLCGLPQPAITERKLEYVFSIMIESAIDACTNDASQTLAITGRTDQDRIKLRFTDTCGVIPVEQLETIFFPFPDAMPNTRGRGLGLAVVNEIVQSLNGDISVDCQDNRTTTFCISLPKD